jgi:ankyrin repeat protein
VEGGANISAVDRFGSTVLDEAVRVGATAVAAHLTGLGAGTAKAEERTARFLNAAAAGDTDLLRFMLANGQPPASADYDARSGLMLAIGGGHFAAATTLLGAGAPADAVDAFGGSALTEAIKLRRKDMVDLLASAGARLDWAPDRAAGTLCQAATEGDTDLIVLYAAAGLDLNAADYDARRAVHIAAADGRVDALKALLALGADINAADRWHATPLLEAVKAVRAGKAAPAFVDLVREAGGVLAVDPAELAGILCSAVQARDDTLLGLYLRAGADPSPADYDRRTPLHIAAAEGALPAVEALVAAGADVGAKDRWGFTPLDEARREKRGPVVDFLTRHQQQQQAGGSGRR